MESNSSAPPSTPQVKEPPPETTRPARTNVPRKRLLESVLRYSPCIFREIESREDLPTAGGFTRALSGPPSKDDAMEIDWSAPVTSNVELYPGSLPIPHEPRECF